MTGGRGPDACIGAVGMEAHGAGPQYALDRVKQALRLHTDRHVRGELGRRSGVARFHGCRARAAAACSTSRLPALLGRAIRGKQT